MKRKSRGTIKKIELHILCGVPGSGKTFYANNYRNAHNCYTTIVDFDEIKKKYGNNSEKISSVIPYKIQSFVFADGLFLDNNDVEWVIDIFLNSPSILQGKAEITKVVLDVWEKDTEACLWNDTGRREETSTYSILDFNINIKMKGLREKYPYILFGKENHKVIKKPIGLCLVKYCDSSKIYYNYYDKTKRYPKFRSRTWSLGGTSYGWDGNLYPINAENPENFDEFDNLLLKICPDISFLMYKKLYNASVTQESQSMRDYYADGSEGYWECDMNKLYEALVELSLLN